MARRKISNPLALAVLGLLGERPMHPYEMSRTLHERQKESSIKLNYGSLYSVVDSLLSRGWVEAQETSRSGRRPERTVYAITEAGRVEFTEWLRELCAEPVKEYTRFEAALSLLPGLPPDEVVDALRLRLHRLDAEIISTDAIIEDMAKRGFARIFSIEGEFVQVQRRAEREFVAALVRDITEGNLDGLEVWREVYAANGAPTEEDWAKAGGWQLLPENYR